MIDVTNLEFAYAKSQKKAVDGISFSIAKGEIFGFLGPSGAGKSTTQKIIIGILKGYRGSVRVMDAEVRSAGRRFYERIGVSFELPNLYPKLTALENLNFFRSLYKDETEEPLALLESVGLRDDAKTPVGEFSKGMKMRLNFCRALLNKPAALFLDEPTSGLDPNNAKTIKDIILKKKNEGTTVFLTTHNMNVAEDLCDRVGFIIDGKVCAIDEPRAFMLKYGKRAVRVDCLTDSARESREFPLDNLGTNERFIALLNSARIESMHTLEATLDDVFIAVTGRSLA